MSDVEVNAKKIVFEKEDITRYNLGKLELIEMVCKRPEDPEHAVRITKKLGKEYWFWPCCEKFNSELFLAQHPNWKKKEPPISL